MNGIDITGKLQNLAELGDYTLVDEVAVQILRAYRYNTSLANEWAEAFKWGQLNNLQVLQPVELRKNWHDGALK